MNEIIEYTNKIYVEKIKQLIRLDYKQLYNINDARLKLIILIKIGSIFEKFSLNEDEIRQILTELEEEIKNEKR
jgi:3-dehydroquinate synthetase